MKSHTKIFLFIILDTLTVKDLSYARTNSIKPLCFTINQINGYIEESNGNKYLTLVFTDEIKYTLIKYEELMKIKFNSDAGLHLKKMLELNDMIMVVRYVFHEGNK